MILRVRSRDGTSRVQIDPDDDMAHLVQVIKTTIKGENLDQATFSRKPSGDGTALSEIQAGQSVRQAGLSHGDLIYITTTAQTDPHAGDKTGIDARARQNVVTDIKPLREQVRQDAVDELLDKTDGNIYRSRDMKLCQHKELAMCDYCAPLEPYDESYLSQHGIKHLSFHAYLKKINSATNRPERGASFTPPLSQLNYKILKPCPSGHPPWPAGICTKCQPPAITLQQQSYRWVDHVEFAHPQIIDQFLQFWRKSGLQRCGWMYGRYDTYPKVPLGLRVIVEAIYEPPQSNELDGVELSLPWAEETDIDRLAQSCGLVRIGLIFTDLTDDGSGSGKVICKRHSQSYLLSSLEVATAAVLQNQHISSCQWSDTGRFGSKFVTCVISGNDEGEVDISAYQVSSVAMALIEADIIEPSVDPGQMLVREETADGYIPEIFYRRINQYGVSVQQDAKPAFPVEYLLVQLTHGFPHEPKPLFLASTHTPFEIENRQEIGQTQNIRSLANLVGITNMSELISMLSDFHLLSFLHCTGVLSSDDEKLFIRITTLHQEEDVYHLLETASWHTITAIVGM